MKTKERHQRVAGTQATPPHAEGVWPRVNRELIKDYPRTKSTEFQGVFRIHLDVPIRDEATFKALETAFEAGNLNVARDVLEKRIGNVSLGTDEHHAWMTIEAALSP